MKKSDKPRLAMTGISKPNGNGFKINSELDQAHTKPGPELTESQKELINDKAIGIITLDDVGRGSQPDILRPKEPPRVEPHLVHDGSGISRCSVCGAPVNFPTGSCGVCQCGAQFGGCG